MNRNKHILSLISVFIIGASSASCSSAPQDRTLPETPTQEQTEEQTESAIEAPTLDPEIEIPPKAEPTEPEINELIYDDNDCKIYYRGVKNNTVFLHYDCNNTTGHLYYLTVRVSAINGEPFEEIIDGALKEGKTEVDEPFSVPIEKLQDKEITRINDITFNVQFCKDYQSYDMYFETGDLTINR